MNTLQVFWDSIKEAALLDFSSLPSFKANFQRFLNNIIEYGTGNPDELRAWALRFTLSRREFADGLNAWLASEGDRQGYTNYDRRRAEICPRCTHLEWQGSMAWVFNGHDTQTEVRVCSKCIRSYYRDCVACGHWREITLDGAHFVVQVRHYGNVCLDCINQNPTAYARCALCNTYHLTSNQEIYRYDRDSTGRYRHNDTSGEVWLCINCQAPERSRCQPKTPEFSFPALNLGPDQTVVQNQILEIAHGGGDIAGTGLSEIFNLIYAQTKGHGSHGIQVQELIQPQFNFDSRWQTAEGNFPKRVAKLLMNLHHLKLTEELMSEIGNIAQRYTSKPGAYRLSITRDVNGPKHEYVNGDSCWWTSYWWSRCNFKSLGGLALRTWEGTIPTGRAWMLPMRANQPGSTNARTLGILQVAPEMLPADAYIVFNGYGPHNSRLDSMEFGRMVAGMTGKSYRKIDFAVSHHYMYVNGTAPGSDAVGKGVLVAEQSICDQVCSYTLRAIPNRCSCPGKPA